jgi:hypothetical protein
LDGEQGYQTSYSSSITPMLSCFIGGYNVFGYSGFNEVYGMNGSMTNIRVTPNEALYTSNFTPPTSQLTTSV